MNHLILKHGSFHDSKAADCQWRTVKEAYLSILWRKGETVGVARGSACRACVSVRTRHTSHCRVWYGGCNSRCNSAKTKCVQVSSDSASLPDSVALETEEHRLEREQNEHDVLDALGDYKCDAWMSVENVPAVVDIKTLKYNTRPLITPAWNPPKPNTLHCSWDAPNLQKYNTKYITKLSPFSSTLLIVRHPTRARVSTTIRTYTSLCTVDCPWNPTSPQPQLHPRAEHKWGKNWFIHKLEPLKYLQKYELPNQSNL